MESLPVLAGLACVAFDGKPPDAAWSLFGSIDSPRHQGRIPWAKGLARIGAKNRR
jgi:hypothetical protein